MKLYKADRLKGEITVPGDKSISHRAVMFGAISSGRTEITNFLTGADCLSTIDCFRRLGITVEINKDKITIYGKGLHGLSVSQTPLDTGNSGTTTRLISGILSAQPFDTVLTGDSSIQKRPMRRIIEPLSMMGADITSLSGNDCAPLKIKGKRLHGIHYHSKVASAQVKSAVLLAGLYAEGQTSVTEPVVSRNHTELMLRMFGANILTENNTAVLSPGSPLEGRKITVPGDISSAAYFIAAALLVPGSDILIKNVGVNPTRDGILKVVKAMGGNITLLNERNEGEPCADLHVTYSRLHGTTIGGDIIPALIDELPVIAVLAAAAEGTTTIKDAAELKVKESNRIDVMVENLSAMGCRITATDDGMIIEGGRPLTGTVINPYKDHRIAMSFAVAALAADGETVITDSSCTAISYPDFFPDLQKLCGYPLI